LCCYWPKDEISASHAKRPTDKKKKKPEMTSRGCQGDAKMLPRGPGVLCPVILGGVSSFETRQNWEKWGLGRSKRHPHGPVFAPFIALDLDADGIGRFLVAEVGKLGRN
jgi:hypothetical protein